MALRDPKKWGRGLGTDKLSLGGNGNRFGQEGTYCPARGISLAAR
jgi:hypothetical protein